MTLNLYLWDSTFLSSIISRHPTRIYLRGGTVGTHRHGAVCAASWRHGHCADAIYRQLRPTRRLPYTSLIECWRGGGRRFCSREARRGLGRPRASRFVMGSSCDCVGSGAFTRQFLGVNIRVSE